MICPLCNKEMKLVYLNNWTTFNPMTCEEVWDCKCGVRYEFSYGTEHFIDKSGNEIEVIL